MLQTVKTVIDAIGLIVVGVAIAPGASGQGLPGHVDRKPALHTPGPEGKWSEPPENTPEY
ncbi:MAG: hypothetical protein M3238_03060 [Actinomycetota bacterium]|nr:hypothetical protein [Actinomycetota bacterium]